MYTPGYPLNQSHPATSWGTEKQQRHARYRFFHFHYFPRHPRIPRIITKYPKSPRRVLFSFMHTHTHTHTRTRTRIKAAQSHAAELQYQQLRLVWNMYILLLFSPKPVFLRLNFFFTHWISQAFGLARCMYSHVVWCGVVRCWAGDIHMCMLYEDAYVCT